MKSFHWSSVLRTLLGVTGLAAALTIGIVPARAQFICVGNATGTAVPPGTADGAGAAAAGTSSNFACGQGANAAGTNSSNTATGTFANASAAAGNSSNTANGASANANGSNSFNIAVGYQTKANGDSSSNIAIGVNADAHGANSRSIAIGANAFATGVSATAVGNGAHATFNNSAAFGNGATATRADQQVFGTAANTYTLSGITSSASAAAQTGPVQLVTSDAGGNLATTTLGALGIASAGDIAGINSKIAGINARIDDLTYRNNRTNSGVAMAYAMAGVPTVLPQERFAVSMNWGTFLGANGLSLNAAARINNYMQVNAGIAYGPDQGIAGGRVGMRVGW